MRSSISRRTFFKSSAQNGLALAGLGLLENFSSAVEPLARAGKARFLLSIAAYSFREFLQSKDPAQKIDLFKQTLQGFEASLQGNNSQALEAAITQASQLRNQWHIDNSMSGEAPSRSKK